ncbi:hypothetical protein [Chitinophaga defluvii]|uniref:HNH endonuclease n=1 Tax=Chitinophaga defluvii TaxID=3163343 RepID=A0ABV2T8T5_9BACT
MIRNPHSIADLDAMALIFYREIEQDLQLNARIAANTVPQLTPLMIHFAGNIQRIITAQPDELEREHLTIDAIFQQAITNHLATNPILRNSNGNVIRHRQQKINYLRKIWKLEINRIFDYDTTDNSFVKISNGKLAYRHATRLQINTCPYCNANFTYTIRTKRMSSRPQFDHFLKKSSYPYFALSFYNLVPSCSLCNSGALKGQKTFSRAKYLHPFVDDIEGLFQFRTKVDAVDFLVNSEDFELKCRPCRGTTNDQRKRASESIDLFCIDDRYKFHKDIAGDVIKKAYVYNKTAIENIFKAFNFGGHSIFTSTSEIKELVMGNYLHADHFHKRILSKMTADIAEEFGLMI